MIGTKRLTTANVRRMRSDLGRHSRFGTWLGTEVVGVDAERRTVEVRYQPREEATNRFGTLVARGRAELRVL